MLTQHIALVPEADGVDASELAKVSAALQKQVTRDFSAAWGITATVDAFPYLEDVPAGYFPIIVSRGELGSQAGVHIDRDGQPYALVRALGDWSLAASRACLEMLVNPFESRVVTAASIRSDQAPVEYLVEVCGPCEDMSCAYTVNGVVVSDFCLPAFFGEKSANADRYSWNSSLAAPFQCKRGGHITWYEPVSNTWWMRSHWGENAVDTRIGPVDRKVFSVRELVQGCTPLRSLPERAVSLFEDRAVHERRASQARAHRLRSLLGAQLESELDAAVEAVLLPSAAAVQVQAPDPDPEPELELDVELEYDFDDDAQTLVTGPAPAAVPASAWNPRGITDRETADAWPQPARAARTTTLRGVGGAPAQRAPRAAAASVAPPLPSRAPSLNPSSIAPVSIAAVPESANARRNGQLLGGVLALAAAAALGFGIRASTARPATTTTSVASVASQPLPSAAPSAVAPAANIAAPAPAPTPAPTPAGANPAPNAAAPIATPSAAARPQRAAQRWPAPRVAPPAPEAPRMRITPDPIDDLIDTRR